MCSREEGKTETCAAARMRLPAGKVFFFCFFLESGASKVIMHDLRIFSVTNLEKMAVF